MADWLPPRRKYMEEGWLEIEDKICIGDVDADEMLRRVYYGGFIKASSIFFDLLANKTRQERETIVMLINEEVQKYARDLRDED